MHSHLRTRLTPALALVAVGAMAAGPVAASPTPGTAARPGADTSGATSTQATSVAAIELIGSAEVATGTIFADTEVGGLSGLVYDAHRGTWLALADDKSEIDPARFYTLDIDVADGTLSDDDVTFTDVTFLRDEHGEPYAEGTLDPEGFELAGPGRMFIGSERDLDNRPWIKAFTPNGKATGTLDLPTYHLPAGDPQDTGVHLNLGYESLTATPANDRLYAATENALAQDGPIATQEVGSPARVTEFSLRQPAPLREFVYEVEPIPAGTVDAGGDNGLVELQALDDAGTFLAMERSFVGAFGNTIRLYETSIAGATDVAGVDDLDDVAHTPMAKELVLQMGPSEFEGITLDNIEGLAFGPELADGRQSLVLVADNNFNDPWQRTLFLAFAIDLE